MLRYKLTKQFAVIKSARVTSHNHCNTSTLVTIKDVYKSTMQQLNKASVSTTNSLSLFLVLAFFIMCSFLFSFHRIFKKTFFSPLFFLYAFKYDFCFFLYQLWYGSGEGELLFIQIMFYYFLLCFSPQGVCLFFHFLCHILPFSKMDMV